MGEHTLFNARCVVYYFDATKKSWAPTQVGNSFCRLDMYENPSTNSYRVVGRGLQDTMKVVINSTITKHNTYQRSSETFHQWSDGKYTYGLNFASKEEAETFGSGFEGIINRLILEPSGVSKTGVVAEPRKNFVNKTEESKVYSGLVARTQGNIKLAAYSTKDATSCTSCKNCEKCGLQLYSKPYVLQNGATYCNNGVLCLTKEIEAVKIKLREQISNSNGKDHVRKASNNGVMKTASPPSTPFSTDKKEQKSVQKNQVMQTEKSAQQMKNVAVHQNSKNEIQQTYRKLPTPPAHVVPKLPIQPNPTSPVPPENKPPVARAKSLAAVSSSLKEGFQLLVNKEYIKAARFFDAKTKDMDAQYLSFYCLSQLGAEDALDLPEHRSLVSFYVQAMLSRQNNNSDGIRYATDYLTWCSETDGVIPKSWRQDMEDFVLELKNTNKPAPKPIIENFNSKWEKAKSVSYVKNAALDSLSLLTGMENVKEIMLDIFYLVNIEKSRGNDPKKLRTHALFEGNPGTGKTTVARIYAKFLLEIGALSGCMFAETSGAKLADEGVNELKQLIGRIERAGGGVLFIDEAYQLDPQKSTQGKAVMNYLLTEFENKIGTLTILFAGYKKEMEKLIEYNLGLESRFAFKFAFEDFSDDQLLSILQGLIENASQSGTKYRVEGGFGGKYMHIVSRRLGRQRGPGFGNGRAVNNYWESILRRQARRLIQEKNSFVENFFLSSEDLLGPNPYVAIESSEAWKQLRMMIGLDKVKESVEHIIDVVKANYDLEMNLKPIRTLTLNRVFLGNPGTGKTTVARLYAQILKDLGILSKGDCVFRTASDFVGSVLGEGEKKTNSLLKMSEGCVLVIDEAYGLFCKNGSDPYKEAVINTIVEKVQNLPGDDRCVVLIGYKEQMEEMMRDSNPGLNRRFNFNDAFYFEDYKDEELMRILNLKLKEKGLSATTAAKLSAVEVLGMQRRLKNFGNGGAVENIINCAIARYEARRKKLPVTQRSNEPMREEDFAPKQEEVELDSIFSDIIGCSEVLELLHEYQKVIHVKKLQGRDPFESLELNFLFVGPPGTGKTTIAMRMGMLFKSMGILGSSEVCVHSASDLIAPYVGQTGKKTRAIVEAALGKVLFIDEAYRLLPDQGSFNAESVNELVQLLTEPRIKNRLVVILAGYKDEINSLMASNPGLKSRFSQYVHFTNFSAEDCWKLLQMNMKKKEHKILPDTICQQINHLMIELIGVQGFGNGRDMDTLSQRVSRYIDKTRDLPTTSDDIIVTKEEMLYGLNDLLKSRKVAVSNQNNTKTTSGFQLPYTSQSMKRSTSSVKTELANSPVINDSKRSVPSSKTTTESRDAGVTDEIWRELAESKRKQKGIEEGRKAEQARLEEEKQKIEEAMRQTELAQHQPKEMKSESEAKRKQLQSKKDQVDKELQELLEQKRVEEEKQRELSRLCPAGYQWYPVKGGWRCGGGSHYQATVP